MKRTVPGIRIFHEIMRDPNVPHLGMQHSMTDLSIHDRAPANSRAHGQVDKVRNSTARAPSRLAGGRRIDVGIKAHRNVEPARDLSRQIKLLPSGLRCRRDESKCRRIGAQINRTKGADAHRTRLRFALAEKRQHFCDRLLRRRGRKRGQFQVVGTGADPANKLRAARFNAPKEAHATLATAKSGTTGDFREGQSWWSYRYGLVPYAYRRFFFRLVVAAPRARALTRFLRPLRIAFLFGTLAETISNDCRIRSCSSSSPAASNRSSMTHLYRPTYGAGRISSRSMSSENIVGVHLKHIRRVSRPSITKILPPTLKHNSSPHCNFSVALGKARQNARMESTSIPWTTGFHRFRRSTGSLTSWTRKYFPRAGYLRATASYIAYATLR